MPSNMKWLVIFAVLLIPTFAYASFDVDPVFEEKIDASILDVAVKSDGDMVFVLSPGAILIYSVEKKTVLDRIPVDKHFTGVAYQENGRLVLTSTNPSMISILQVSRVYDINIKNRAVKGPSDAGATIVVFDDYQCPYCARLERYIQQVLDKFPNDVNYVIKHFPLSSHKLSRPGAMAALAAEKQGQFWAFHSKLLENHNQLNEEKIVEIAKELELNMDQFAEDRQLTSSRKLIDEDLENGKRIGVRGTPTVFLNGKRIGNKDLGKLPQLIRKELGK